MLWVIKDHGRSCNYHSLIIASKLNSVLHIVHNPMSVSKYWTEWGIISPIFMLMHGSKACKSKCHSQCKQGTISMNKEKRRPLAVLPFRTMLYSFLSICLSVCLSVCVCPWKIILSISLYCHISFQRLLISKLMSHTSENKTFDDQNICFFGNCGFSPFFTPKHNC